MGLLNDGTKQGCPLSPILFVLSLGIVLVAIKRRTGADLGGFADDLGIGVDNLKDWNVRMGTVNLLRGASAMRLLHTVDVLPDWIVRWFSQGDWSQVDVLPQKAEHPGVPMGRGICIDLMWDKPWKRCNVACEEWATTTVSETTKTPIANTFLIPIFRIFQFFILFLPK